MRSMIAALVTLAALLGSAGAMAQKLPDGAPAGTTVQCKDGSFESPENKSGACSGHKGIKTWYGKTAAKASDKQPDKAADKQASKASDKPAATSATGQPPAVQTQSADVRKTEIAPSTGSATKAPATQDGGKNSTAAAAPGGGTGKVWVNEESKVYHCMGDRYYGKTKKGDYMSESEATAKGARPANKKACATS